MPQLKIIYLLRDPIECAWSAAGAHFEHKPGIHGISNAAPEDVERYFAKTDSVRHLLYAQNLANWERHFPADQIQIGFYDDLKANPRQIFQRILSFLGLEDYAASLPADVDRKHGTRAGRRSEKVPERYHRFLARLYIDSLVEIDARLSNEHTARWLSSARAALSGETNTSM
jgi:hypothetical protein